MLPKIQHSISTTQSVDSQRYALSDKLKKEASTSSVLLSLKELPYNGVYKLSYSGSLSLIIDDLSIPNGIAVSNDQKTLYVNISDRKDMKIMSYDITSKGVTNGRVFFDGNELAKKDNGSFLLHLIQIFPSSKNNSS